MAKALTRIPLEEFSTDVAGFFARVVHDHEAVMVEGREGEIAELRPVRPAKSRRRGRRRTAADHAAFLSSFGSWSDVDIDVFIEKIYEGRRMPSRPPVEL